MRNDEDEEPLEAEVLRARMNTRVPPVERNKNMKILDMLSADVGEKVVSKVAEAEDNIEVKCWWKRNEKERLPLLPLITVS